MVVVALILGTPSAADEMEAARFEPTHTRATADQINPRHNGIQTDSLRPPLHLLWKRSLSRPSYALVAGGKVFVASVTTSGQATLRALAPRTGHVIWQSAAGSNGLLGATYGDGRVYVAAETPGFRQPGDRVRAYLASNGRHVWSTDIPSEYSSQLPPTAAGRFVYEEAGGRIYALRSLDGDLVWQSSAMNGSGTSPTISDRDVIAALPSEETYAFDRQTGRLHWHHPYSTGCRVESDYVGAIHGGRLYAPNLILDVSTGEEIGCYDSNFIPTFAPGLLYTVRISEFNTSRRKLVAVKSSDGSIAWDFLGDRTIYRLLVDGGILYAGSAYHLYALRPASGRVVWRTHISGGITHVTAGGGAIFVSTLHALRAYA